MKMKNISVSMVTEDEVKLVELDGEPEAQTPGCLFVCHLILLLMCFLFNIKNVLSEYKVFDYMCNNK